MWKRYLLFEIIYDKINDYLLKLLYFYRIYLYILIIVNLQSKFLICQTNLKLYSKDENVYKG